MRALRTYGFLLLAVPLLGLLALYPFVQSSSKKVHVSIFDNCMVTTEANACIAAADPETTCASIGDTVIWTHLGLHHDYSANFLPAKTPFHRSDFSGSPVPVVSAGPQGQLVTSDAQCLKPISVNDRACYFSYDVYRYDGDGNSTKCGDPGVRVVPPSKISVWRWLKSFLGFRG
jgi:hypothetical protein